MSDERAMRIEVIGEPERWAPLPESGTLVLGSSSERAGLVVAGQGVEDAHCAIGRIKGGGWAIKDLGSRYGVIVNGAKVSTARLWIGDTIVLGSRRLRVVDPENPPAAETPPAAPSERRLGGYRIERMLGKGGMGQVWLAVQENLSRPVALKVLAPKLAADADFVRRFQSEARAAAALSHPNVVVVHDVGEADGHHFLSMEYMAGGSLEDKVAEGGALPWREALNALHDAACGLTYAESKGIVHRDIKPANLMIAASGTVKIADLGLATTVEAEATQDEGKKIFGTPHFISPEQARGEPVDHRSDLYSLGATFYRVVTGHTPFEGDTTRAILRARFTETPLAPSAHVPELPPGLDALLLRLLAREPAERPSSAEELRREVERLRIEADHGAFARPGGGRKGLLVAVPLLALAGVGAWLVLGRGQDEPRDAEVAAAPAPEPERPAEPPEKGEEALARELEMLDLKAKLALSQIPAGLAPEERIEALRGVAREYPATETARAALAEARGLEAEREGAARALALRERTLETARAELAALARAPGDAEAAGDLLPRPADAAKRVLAWVPPPELARDGAGVTERSAAVERVLAGARERFGREIERARGMAAEGRFEDAAELLDAVLDHASLVSLPDDVAREERARYRLLLSRASRARDGLDTARRAWLAEQSDADRATLVDALGRRSTLVHELSTLELAESAERLSSLTGRLTTEEARAEVEELLESIAAARAALELLVREYESGGWRRQSVPDPEGKRPMREAVGATPEGLLVDVDGSAALYAWGRFAATSESVQQLFKGRLVRDYTPDERRSITALLRLVGAAEVARLADDGLDPAARFDDGEETRLCTAFQPALSFASDRDPPPDDPGAIEGALAPDFRRAWREHEAARLLATALRAADGGSWATAVASLELLLGEHGGSLVVTLLSDGTPWRTTAPPEHAAADEGEAPEAEEDSGG